MLYQKYDSFIRFNNEINLYELMGCEYTQIDLRRREEKKVRITAGSKEHCIEMDKKMFPGKYF